jgi:endoglycosylceramidase
VLPALASGCKSSKSGPVARTCAIAAPDRTSWRLHADGVKFKDDQGRVVLLRGVDAGGRSKFAPFVPFDYPQGGYDAALASYMDRAASWGISAMRVPFTWAAVEPTQGTYDEEFLGRYEKLLDAAWARSIWTVVDFHQDVYAEVFCGDGFPAWTVPDPKPAPHHDCPGWSTEYAGDTGVKAAFDRFWAQGSTVATAYQAMWDHVVGRFKDRPGVVGFEPINEPGWGTADMGTFEATTLTAFYSSIVARMRAAAPSSLVFVDPTGFAGLALSTKLGRPIGDGIVFAPHYYPLGAPDLDTVVTKMKTWSDVGAAWNTPVFVGEFGMSHAADDAPAYMAAHFDAFDALGLSGTEWEYSVAAEAWNAEDDGLVDATGKEYPVASAVLRPFARAVAGEVTATSYDAAGNAFTLTFVSTGPGVSEVSLPARAFPAGFDVSLSGGCVDTSHTGMILVQADAGSRTVDLRVTSK